MWGDLANKLRAQVAIGLPGQHKNGFQARLEFAIHQRHLQFVFVVRNSADAAKDHASAAFASVIDEQSFEHIHFDVRPFLGDFAQHLHALGHAEQRLLFRVAEHGHDQEIEHFLAALDQIQVAVGDRVKRARIDGNGSFHCDSAVGLNAGLF